MRIIIIAIFCIACSTKQNPNVCCTNEADCAAQGLPDGTGCADGLMCKGNQCVVAEACSGSTDCDATAPYCVMQSCAPACTDDSQCPGEGEDASDLFCVSGACVVCRIGMNDCPADAPICDANACRTCALDSECPSTVCDVDKGTCVDPAAIRYAAADGVDANSCAQASPCTLSKAISLVDVDRPWVRMVPGVYSADTAVSAGTFTLVGTGATTTGSISVGAANVTIRGLVVEGSVDTDTCVSCAASGVSDLTLQDVKVEICQTFAQGCQLTIRQSETAGLELANDTATTIDRSIVGSIEASRSSDSATFALQAMNSLIVGSSLQTALDLGNLLGSSPVPVSVSIAYSNIYNPGNYQACIGLPSGISFTNDIFYSPGAANALQGTTCVLDTNVMFPQALVLGTNTIMQDPLLVDPATGDFHLMAGSPAIDAAKTIVNDPTVDYDGTPRPQGPRSDIGAFEYH